MERQESEARKREIIRQIGRLANDLEELEHEVSDEGEKGAICNALNVCT